MKNAALFVNLGLALLMVLLSLGLLDVAKPEHGTDLRVVQWIYCYVLMVVAALMVLVSLMISGSMTTYELLIGGMALLAVVIASWSVVKFHRQAGITYHAAHYICLMLMLVHSSLPLWVGLSYRVAVSKHFVAARVPRLIAVAVTAVTVWSFRVWEQFVYRGEIIW